MAIQKKPALLVAVAFTILAASVAPATAKLGDKIVDAAASATLNMIQTSSCADFAAKIAAHKSGSSGASMGHSGMLKSNPAARQRFVDKVAGPLLNKLIDCGMLPK